MPPSSHRTPTMFTGSIPLPVPTMTVASSDRRYACAFLSPGVVPNGRNTPCAEAMPALVPSAAIMHDVERATHLGAIMATS
jgi:hypothetical protein